MFECRFRGCPVNGKRIDFRRILGILTVLLCLLGGSVSANGYTTEHFQVNVKVNRDHSYEFSEEITVDFSSPHHGIYRDIPYQLGRTVIKDISVAGQPFTVKHQHQDGKSVARIIIGEEDRTLTGEWTYHIRYRIVSTVGEQEGADEIYLNLLPHNWETSIRSASCTLTMPEEIDWNNVTFYSGSYGSKGLSEKFHISSEKDFLLVEAEYIQAREGFTIKGRLPEGFWQGEFDHRRQERIYFAILVGIAGILILMWFLFGRDAKTVPSVEVFPPEGISPLDAGYLIDGEASEHDLLALIPYFAQKKYLSIQRDEDGGTILERLIPVQDVKESMAVVEVFCGLFPDGLDRLNTSDTNSSKIFTLSRLRREHFDLAKRCVQSDHDMDDRMYTKQSKIAWRVGLGIVVLPILSVLFYVSWVMGSFPDNVWWVMPIPFLIGAYSISKAVEQKYSRTWAEQVIAGVLSLGMLALGYVIVRRFLSLFYTTDLLKWVMAVFLVGLFFEVNMFARTEDNAELMGKLLGFKEFIRVAELDRIRMLVNEDPNYFFDVLPYAYVFGLTDAWTGHFEALKLEQPDWYMDRTRPFFDFPDMVRSVDSISRSFASVDSDTGSDSDGFSGGGDGGGGGGAW